MRSVSQTCLAFLGSRIRPLCAGGSSARVENRKWEHNVGAASSTAAFVGFGQSRMFRRAEVSLGQLTVEACLAAVEDAGLQAAQIDGVVCTPDGPFSMQGPALDGEHFVTTGYVTKALGIEPEWVSDVSGTIGNSAVAAIQAIESGACNYVLLFRGLYSPKTGSYGYTAEERVGQAEGNPGSTEVHEPKQFRDPYGIYAPAASAALAWTRYQAKYGSGSRDQMATLVVQARRNGLKYEGNYWTQYNPVELSVDDYLNARIVSTPVSLYDCDIPVQGAGAFILTTSERAADLAKSAAFVRGVANGPPAARGISVNLSLDDQLSGGRDIARRLWGSSGFSPSDVSVAELYDGFSMLAITWLESLGFCGEGEAFDFIQDGRISQEGQLPVNPSGGNLGGGRLHGVNHLMDGFLQMAGRAGTRQVPDADLALVATGPPCWAGSAILLGREPS